MAGHLERRRRRGLLNQCPHNLDLLCWFCGMPEKITAFCKEGHYHDIEVEDDATLYMEWTNGASGTFITSTGDAPGVNRLEIFLEEALIKAENRKLEIFELEPELGMKECEYRKTADDCFRKIHGVCKEITLALDDNPYFTVFRSFANAFEGKGNLIAQGAEGRNSLMLSNATYLSSWKYCTVTIPKQNTPEEEQFEKEFETMLRQKQG